MYEIRTVRTEILGPGHEHIQLVGYVSGHIEQEPIKISPERVAGRIAMGDSFGITIGDETAEVKAAPCPVCGETAHLKTSKDTREVQHLLALPQT